MVSNLVTKWLQTWPIACWLRNKCCEFSWTSKKVRPGWQPWKSNSNANKEVRGKKPRAFSQQCCLDAILGQAVCRGILSQGLAAPPWWNLLPRTPAKTFASCKKAVVQVYLDWLLETRHVRGLVARCVLLCCFLYKDLCRIFHSFDFHLEISSSSRGNLLLKALTIVWMFFCLTSLASLSFLMCSCGFGGAVFSLDCDSHYLHGLGPNPIQLSRANSAIVLDWVTS